MALPYWTPHNLLPPGRHPADLADVYERLVFDAPHQNDREILFSALNSYLGVARRIMPTGRAWIGGDLTARTPHTPLGLDVVLIPDEWGALKRLDDAGRSALYGLLTLRGVIVGQPAMYLDQVQPVGGMLDGFLCRPGDEEIWEEVWAAGGRGIPEVIW
ncbi:DUF6932 family protein [Amycolatopsis azurea]|uniref:Uncharacterized protein n=1 Tax=Amycolatopsis azurea DSM 43854 TaxID=1238180 RepID=M2QFB2_9PSEU|nr:hypothetical protein [Amycolatopsis azurea]EMD25411.1 hypothetical protein C791_4777 [Amycolatopsis azurea DSM 43854]OOC08573.1 hypothetical protein B0293_01285 [Amycolatopsis azurea DSM 43854]